MNHEEIKAKIGQKRQEMREMSAKLGRLVRGQLPLEEVIDRVIPHLVRETGARWLRGPQAEALIRGPQSLASPSAGLNPLPWQPGATLPWDAMCAADPEGAVRILTALMRAIPAYEAGPPSAERPALIERLTRELGELERDEEALVDEAQAAGVGIPHRIEAQRQRVAEAVGTPMGSNGSRRREAAINAQPRRSVFSYLRGKE